MRNALAHVPTRQRPAVIALLKTIFAQESAKPAHEQWTAVADGLRERFPKLAGLMDGAREDVLAYMAFPREHWPEIASTNPLERLNGEIKRRTEVVVDTLWQAFSKNATEDAWALLVWSVLLFGGHVLPWLPLPARHPGRAHRRRSGYQLSRWPHVALRVLLARRLAQSWSAIASISSCTPRGICMIPRYTTSIGASAGLARRGGAAAARAASGVLDTTSMRSRDTPRPASRSAASSTTTMTRSRRARHQRSTAATTSGFRTT